METVSALPPFIFVDLEVMLCVVTFLEDDDDFDEDEDCWLALCRWVDGYEKRQKKGRKRKVSWNGGLADQNRWKIRKWSNASIGMDAWRRVEDSGCDKGADRGRFYQGGGSHTWCN